MMDSERLGIYRYGCLNCDGEIDDYRLIHKAPCSKCIPQEEFSKLLKIVESKRLGFDELVKLYRESVVDKKGIEEIYDETVKIEDFERFFETATRGLRPWSSQITWAKRLLRKKSFSIVAPTGTGKTVFALIYSLYLVSKNPSAKVMLVFPTRILLQQAYSKIKVFAENAGLKICDESIDKDCISILSTMLMNTKNRRTEILKMIEEGRFNILLATNKFVYKHCDKLIGKNYELIVLDDVDAVLKSSRAITTLFQILGLSREEIELVIKYIIELRRAGFKDNEELRGYEETIRKLKEKIRTTVLVSSATGRPRGVYPKLFKVLLGFDIGTKSEAIRNVVDCYIHPMKQPEEVLISLIKILGDGGLIYVPVDMGVVYADKIRDMLTQSGIKAESFYSGKPLRLVEDFVKGNLDVLIGVATHYGVMVRGLDFPERVKYTVFLGVPRHKFSAKLESPGFLDLIRILGILINALEGDERRSAEAFYGKLISRFRRLSPGVVRLVDEKFRKKLSGETVEDDYVVQLLDEALNLARSLLARQDVWEKMRSSGEIGVVREGDREFILVPDVSTYIQASGRCSRLYPGGITKGLSIIIVDDVRLLNGLRRKMRYVFEDVDFKELDLAKNSDIEALVNLIKEISEERAYVKKIISGEISVDKKLELTKSALLIVESPNKAKTIARFFGKPSVRVLENGLVVYDTSTGKYTLSIVATMGHLYDLTVDVGWDDQGVIIEDESLRFIPVYTDIKKCVACGYQFTLESESCPRCKSESIIRKRDVMRAIRLLAREVDLVLIGTDPDTEGEKIGWDVKVLLEPYVKEIKRIEFHEVTRRAVLESLNNPREFLVPLVKSQIVRRIEDRWLGFSLSRILQTVLWSKYCYRLHQLTMTKLFKKMLKSVKTNNTRFIDYDEFLQAKLVDCCASQRNLSAGRVQTPVLGFIIDRFNESRDKSKWRVAIEFKIGESGFERITVPLKELINKYGDKVLSAIKNKKVLVKRKDVVETEINPPPPYTTDTLLEDASQKQGLSVMKTMEIAQDLFEAGLITYHRTDSTRVSDHGINIAKIYLEQLYGENHKELFKPRSYGTEGAHECIRITKPIDPNRLKELVREGLIYVPKPLTRQHYEVYGLIFKRFIASQMKQARVIVETYVAEFEGVKSEFSRVTRILDPGFLQVYKDYLQVKDQLEEGEYDIVNTYFIKPPLARYHDVINWMKMQKIGRPSTYAKIVQTLIDRRYVKVVGKNVEKALVPTTRGLILYRELKSLYSKIIDVDKTRELEYRMEMIEKGEIDYQAVLKEIFREVIEDMKYEKVIRFEEEYAKKIRELLCGE